MAKIRIETPEAERIQGENARGSYDFHVQRGLLFRDGEEWPDKIKLSLPRDRGGTPYKPGDYDLAFRPWSDDRGRVRVAFDLVPE